MNRFLLLVIALSASAGCFVVQAPAEKAASKQAAPSGDEDVAAQNAACGGTESGLPAAVDAMLSARCQTCHGASTKLPVKLLTYDDLVAADPDDGSKTVADAVLARIQDADSPMPPGKGTTVPQEEIDAMQAWIDGGKQKAEGSSCGDDAGTDAAKDPVQPEFTDPICTSGQTWAITGTGKHDGNDDDGIGVRMNPGLACISCHQNKTKRNIVQVGGTVYATKHEKDLCFGTNPSGAKVVIIDQNGAETNLDIADTGNFALSTEDKALAFPITAKVVLADGSERVMSSPQDSGDCNSCHTEQGDNGAPGRIFLP